MFIQQPAALSELYSHANPDNGRRPADASHNYLSAVKLMFEDGFLSSTRVADMASPVLENIQEGYRFFKNWWIELDEESMFQSKLLFLLQV